MEADDAWFFCVIEMARDGVADHGFEFVERIGFGKNGEAEGAGLVAAFWRLLDGEDNFALSHVFGP